ncbi:MAG: D-alanyl-D-alanine carboxypeptidase [Clostridiales bacterium]|jgi:D-alanyl-D-alanine carboxypeptidase (penicillin-binding protein 5/6)|nr:D-alanyl-D-alanine carboxypeptidase [Clostridiales bacterium]
MKKILLLAAAVLIGLLASEAKPAVAVAVAESVPSSAAGMAAAEVSSGRLLYEHNGKRRLPMASTTKVLTAITVIENCGIKEIVTVDPRAVGVEGSSIYLQKGEKLSVEDLLFGLMLQSGNDAAEALAYYVSGGIGEFAALMNETAQKAGAVDSHFVNPHGLHSPEHYTTAEDLAAISCFAMRNPDFHRIAGSKTHRTGWANHEYGRVINNKNKILSLYKGGNGIKTGFTRAAGRCLVSSAYRNGMEVVCVVLNCGEMWRECMDKMDLAFREYNMREILPKYVERIDIDNAVDGFVLAETQNGFAYPMKKNEEGRFSVVITLPSALNAPLKEGAEIGSVEIYCDEQLLTSQKIYTLSDVKEIRPKFFDYLNRVLKGWSLS